jgi:hypothetical protein
MKHATMAALAPLTGLLARLDALPNVKRRGIGTFYVKSKPLLHFHEDPAGIFADVAVDGGWQRLPVNTTREQEELFRVLASRAGI